MNFIKKFKASILIIIALCLAAGNASDIIMGNIVKLFQMEDQIIKEEQKVEIIQITIYN